MITRYQASNSTFKRAGYSQEEAERIMLKSVKLADEARERFAQERKDVTVNDVRIALSLGPFGASLFPAQEFDGFYPPPYGPKAFSEGGKNCNAFDGDESLANSSIDALALFHLERLQIFANNSDAWNTIDCIAFETVPLAREIRAIRKAVGILQARRGNQSFTMKPWWISLVCPSGKCPETEHAGGPHLSMGQVAEATLGEGMAYGPPPNAIGLNCIQAEFLPELLSGLRTAVDQICEEGASRPWLVVYPNGGDVYDPVARTWQVKRAAGGKEASWAETLSAIIENVKHHSSWEGIIVGGCCRVGPDEINVISNTI